MRGILVQQITAVCERCHQPFIKRQAKQVRCGSVRFRLGCAWLNRLDNRRVSGLKCYHRNMKIPERRKRILEQSMKCHWKHREKKLLAFHNRYLAKRETELARHRAWAKANPVKVAHKQCNRIHRKRANGGTLRWREWTFLLEAFNYTCPGCNRSDVKLTRDHKVPIVHGGRHQADNIQPLCQPCNNLKYMTPMYAACRLSDRTMHLAEGTKLGMSLLNLVYPHRPQINLRGTDGRMAEDTAKREQVTTVS